MVDLAYAIIAVLVVLAAGWYLGVIQHLPLHL